MSNPPDKFRCLAQSVSADLETLGSSTPEVMGLHMRSLGRLGATRQEIDETLGVTTSMGGGPSLMYAASPIAPFGDFSRAPSARACLALA